MATFSMQSKGGVADQEREEERSRRWWRWIDKKDAERSMRSYTMQETRWWPMFHHRSYKCISRVILNCMQILCYSKPSNYIYKCVSDTKLSWLKHTLCKKIWKCCSLQPSDFGPTTSTTSTLGRIAAMSRYLA